MLKSLRHLWLYWTNYLIIRILVFPVLKQNVTLETFGNAGASWKVPSSLLTKNSICYCAGVGEDISFELALSERIHPQIFLFDPTPRAIRYIQKQNLPKKMQFFQWGLWSTNSRQKFFAPPQASFVSHSIVNLHDTTEYFLAECKSLDWILTKLGHTTIDLLKIDIEGAEYEVLKKMLRTRTRPRIIEIEFDQPTPVLKTYTMIKQLLEAKYTLVDQTNWNFIFIRNTETTI